MTNRERYRRMCAPLHASRETVMEVTTMKKQAKRLRIGRIIAAAACITALLTGSAFAANTATDGALFEQMRCWVNGEEVGLTYHESGDYYEFENEENGVHGRMAKDGSSGEVTFDGDADASTAVTMETADGETTVSADSSTIDASDYEASSYGTTVTK